VDPAELKRSSEAAPWREGSPAVEALRCCCEVK